MRKIYLIVAAIISLRLIVALDYGKPPETISNPIYLDIQGPVDPKDVPEKLMDDLERGETIPNLRIIDQAVPLKIWPILEDGSLYIIDMYKMRNSIIVRDGPRSFQILKKHSDLGGSLCLFYLPFGLILALALWSVNNAQGGKEMLRFSIATALIMVSVVTVGSSLPQKLSLGYGLAAMTLAGTYFGGRVRKGWGGFLGGIAGLLTSEFIGNFAGSIGMFDGNCASQNFAVVWECVLAYLIICLIATLAREVACSLMTLTARTGHPETTLATAGPSIAPEMVKQAIAEETTIRNKRKRNK